MVKVKVKDPHDKFFRSSMQNAPIARAFFQQYLPQPLLDALDIDSFGLESSSYIDEKLQETFSDLVFNCRYHKNNNSPPAKVILLVEHQSTSDQFMAFRIFHYLFCMLYNELKARSKEQVKAKLPAVYVLIFYHGKQTPYPFSLLLADCFDDPMNLMGNIFNTPVPLIDVNLVQDDELRKQQLLGIMTGVMKHNRYKDVARHFIYPSSLKLQRC